VKYSYTNPDETVVTNVTGTLNVCNACRHERVRRLVHTSSAGVYGSSEKGEAIDESHPVRAYNPYTASKLAADNVVESYYLSYDVPVSICRIFNIYGPRVGRFLVIPTIIQQILETNEVRLGDLTPTRNFTYVSDIVQAFIRMAEEDVVIGQIVNFGSPNAITIGELAKLIAKVMGAEIDIRFDPARIRPRKSEIFRTEADSTKARKTLGWEPLIPLEEGLKLTVDWIREVGYKDVQSV
jgi:dTDP-glucose 4,6-dehydratase